MRGATARPEGRDRGRGISIHAPHAGRDGHRRPQFGGFGISIHAPHAGRDRKRRSMRSSSPRFQSTRPMRGATAWQEKSAQATEISIHAPHAGRDSSRFGRIGRSLYFNPRAPCGARLYRCVQAHTSQEFQSTRPMRGATTYCKQYGIIISISIHAPHAGRDLPDCTARTSRTYFNPRAPCGARLRG